MPQWNRAHLRHDRRSGERGQTLVEYGLLLSLVAAVAISALLFLGPVISSTFSNVAQQGVLGSQSSAGNAPSSPQCANAAAPSAAPRNNGNRNGNGNGNGGPTHIPLVPGCP